MAITNNFSILSIKSRYFWSINNPAAAPKIINNLYCLSRPIAAICMGETTVEQLSKVQPAKRTMVKSRLLFPEGTAAQWRDSTLEQGKNVRSKEQQRGTHHNPPPLMYHSGNGRVGRRDGRVRSQRLKLNLRKWVEGKCFSLSLFLTIPLSFKWQ